MDPDQLSNREEMKDFLNSLVLEDLSDDSNYGVDSESHESMQAKKGKEGDENVKNDEETCSTPEIELDAPLYVDSSSSASDDDKKGKEGEEGENVKNDEETCSTMEIELDAPLYVDSSSSATDDGKKGKEGEKSDNLKNDEEFCSTPEIELDAPLYVDSSSSASDDEEAGLKVRTSETTLAVISLRGDDTNIEANIHDACHINEGSTTETSPTAPTPTPSQSPIPAMDPIAPTASVHQHFTNTSPKAPTATSTQSPIAMGPTAPVVPPVAYGTQLEIQIDPHAVTPAVISLNSLDLVSGGIPEIVNEPLLVPAEESNALTSPESTQYSSTVPTPLTAPTQPPEAGPLALLTAALATYPDTESVNEPDNQKRKVEDDDIEGNIPKNFKY